jgi:predicted extracellular nuclease
VSILSIIGALNAYAKEAPLVTLTGAGYINLVEALVPPEQAYSYGFQGAFGYLDHALASATLRAQVSGVTIWHINADEPVALDYNTEGKSASQITSLFAPSPFRSSDHDPVIVGLNLRGP